MTASVRGLIHFEKTAFFLDTHGFWWSCYLSSRPRGLQGNLVSVVKDVSPPTDRACVEFYEFACQLPAGYRQRICNIRM